MTAIYGLSPRELQVVELVLRGHATRHVARVLDGAQKFTVDTWITGKNPSHSWALALIATGWPRLSTTRAPSSVLPFGVGHEMSPSFRCMWRHARWGGPATRTAQRSGRMLGCLHGSDCRGSHTGCARGGRDRHSKRCRDGALSPAQSHCGRATSAAATSSTTRAAGTRVAGKASVRYSLADLSAFTDSTGLRPVLMYVGRFHGGKRQSLLRSGVRQ
jgi:hypothetical protein